MKNKKIYRLVIKVISMRDEKWVARQTYEKIYDECRIAEKELEKIMLDKGLDSFVVSTDLEDALISRDYPSGIKISECPKIEKG